MKPLKRIILLFTMSLIFLSGLVSAQGNAPLPAPSATLTVDLKVYALPLGGKAETSSGVLTYKGKQYPFTVKGIGLLENQSGASHYVAEGAVYNLNNVADFAGRYFTVQGGMEEKGSSKIRNDKNVVVSLKGWSKGPITFSPEGGMIEFTK